METMRWSEQIVKDSIPAPTIKNHSVTHFNGYLYCFGGYDGSRNHDTLLLYSIHEEKWIRPHHVGGTNGNNNGNNASNNNDMFQNERAGPTDMSIVVTGTPPPGRNGHSATLAADPDDEENGRIIIIGGWLGTGPLAASDMHVLDISNGGKNLRWHQPAVKGTPPGPCNMHSADYVPQRKEVYVFRGGNGREYLNDLHALNAKTLAWRKVQTVGQHPQQRANHSSALLEETGELFIFGGWNGTERLNDIHILNIATSTWTCPRAGGVLPNPRAGMTLTALRGRLFLFGGSGTSSKCFHDLQILDRQEMAWLDVTQYGGAESGSNNRGHGRFEGDQNHHQDPDNFHPQWRFGGYDADMDNNRMDLDAGPTGCNQQGSFTSSRADWRSREMAIRPRGAAVASCPNPNDEDTIPSVLVDGRGPGRRAGHTSTAVNRKIFVFGGSCGSDYLNDFYVLDTDPPPRAVVTEPTSLNLVERRLRHFFNDEEFSDVTFIVQGQKVYGHKMVLSLVSDYFRSMFTGGFRESDSMEIEISDCSYGAFLVVMEYVYTGSRPQLQTGGDREAELNRLIEVLELADRFFLDNLKQICETLIQTLVNSETYEFLLQVAQKTNAMQLQAVCEHFSRNRDTI
mmetsp:Transcript_14304/g.41123  ORF Transcript_14304/g.41123 Transcript_14304/m.41123 type:complete len:626 (-) Transcript_14304:32-1909(-)